MGLNDPQWGGGRKNDGPPDLEDLLRKLNAKVANLLNNNNGTPPTDNGGPRSPVGRGGLGLILAVVALVWLGSGFYIVKEGQRGVVLRFGKKVDLSEAGLRWHLPSPLETVEIVNMSQVRTVEVGYRDNVKNKQLQESLMLTDDENIIDVQFAVQYALSDAADYLFNNSLPRDKEAQAMATNTLVRQVAETAIREIVGKSKMDFVLYQGREEVADAAKRLMQQTLDRYKSGIRISNLTMQNAQPPEQVQAAFDDAVKAGQDRERQKNEGQAYANDVVPRAKGNAARLMQEAEGYKQRVIATAEGDTSRFRQILVEYEKAPAVTKERMYLDMMQQVMSNVSKVMVDQKNGNSLLYLPLDKLVETSRNQAAAPAETAAPVAAPAAAPADSTSRTRADNPLTRDREARP